MFHSEPICILTAGKTADKRDIEQQVIDDIAETYDPKYYTARINEDHSKWSWKGGSVLSAEKRGDELWAVIKPNSHLLRNIENGQLLHTSCEFERDFAGSGKAYLTGLAFTDEPASLGTTQVHLSKNSKDSNREYVSTGHTLNAEHFSQQNEDNDDSLFQKFKGWLKREDHTEQLSTHEDDEMSKETEELLKQSIEQNQQLNNNVSQLVEQLSKQTPPEEPEEPKKPEANQEVTELKGQVEQLSSQVSELTEKFNKTTDEGERKLAGQDGEDEVYL